MYKRIISLLLVLVLAVSLLPTVAMASVADGEGTALPAAEEAPGGETEDPENLTEPENPENPEDALEGEAAEEQMMLAMNGGVAEVSSWSLLRDALQGAGVNTVRLTKDITYSTSLMDDRIIVTGNKRLDLNGHTVNVNTIISFIITVEHGGSLTVCDSGSSGKLKGTLPSLREYVLIKVESGGSFTLEGGTVEITVPSADSNLRRSAIRVCEGATAVFTDGTVLANTSTYESTTNYRYMATAVEVQAKARVTINGGTFDLVRLDSCPTEDNYTPELLIRSGSFKKSVVMALTGNIAWSDLDHLPLEVRSANFLYNTSTSRQNRLVVAGAPKQDGYHRYENFRLTDVPSGTTQDEIIKKLNSLVQYLITPNGAVSCDATGTHHWYVRGNMNKTASENGPARGNMGKYYSDYPYQRGLQGNLILVISDAYYFKEAKLRSSGTLQDVPFANSNTLSPTRIDYSGDRDSLLNLYWYLDERLQEDDYVIANGCFREKDRNGKTTKTYGIDLTFENDDNRFHKNGLEFTNWSQLEKEIRLVENTTDQDILNRIESTVWLLHWPGRTKHTYTVTEGSYTSHLWYSENTSEKTEFEVVDKIEACMQFRQIRRYKTTILDVGLSIDKPLVEGDTSSGAFTVSDSNAGYTMVDTYGYWDEDDFPLKPGNNFPANLKWMYHRLLTLTAKTGYRFDKEELPRVTVTGLNRPCDSITVKYKDETTIQVYLDAHPSEVIQYAYGTVSELKVGKKASQVKVKQDDTINATIYGKYEFTDVEVLKYTSDGTTFVKTLTSSDIIEDGFTYKVKLLGRGKDDKTFVNLPAAPLHSQGGRNFYTTLRLRMNNDDPMPSTAFADCIKYDNGKYYFTSDPLTPEPSTTVYNSLLINVQPVPWANARVPYAPERLMGLPDGVHLQEGGFEWYKKNADGSASLRLKRGVDKFQLGETYYCWLRLDVDFGYEISKNAKVSVNGKEAVYGPQARVIKVEFTTQGGVWGDLNGDNKRNIMDVQALYAYLTDPSQSPTAGANACDLNDDGSVDVYDLQLLYEVATGLATPPTL